MNISTKEHKRLEKLSKSLGIDVEELLKEFNEEYTKLETSKFKGNIEHLAVNGVMNRHRREKQRQLWTPRNPPVVVYGFITGDAGMRDKAQDMRKKARNTIEREGLQFAKDAQLINGDNEILDQRTHIYGKENPKHMEPLNPKLKLRSRTLFGCMKLNGESKFKYGSIHTEDNRLARAWDQIPFFTPFQTYGLVKENTDDNIRLNSSQAKETTSVFKKLNEEWGQTPEAIHKIIIDTIGKQLTSIDKVEEHYEAFKDAWDRKIFVKGVVSWLGLERPTSWGAIWMGLMDAEAGIEADYQVRVQIPPHIKVDFGEQSEVIVFGRTKRSNIRDEEDNWVPEGDVVITANGIWPIPGLTTPKETSQLETLEDEDQIEGWLE